jgi:hypothetical protein
MIATQYPIGTVKGPGETPNEYTFIAPDPERRVKHGEFVYYVTRSMARSARSWAA